MGSKIEVERQLHVGDEPRGLRTLADPNAAPE
jgi:hypothetical protein